MEYAKAFKGPTLIGLKTDAYKKAIFSEFKNTLISLCENQLFEIPDWLAIIEWKDLEALDLKKSRHDEETLLYWSGWPITSRKGQKGSLNLFSLYFSHGNEFTIEFYSRWRGFFAKQARLNHVEINFLAKYLSQNPKRWPASTFQNPISITHFFNALLKEYFLHAHSERLSLNARIKSWNRFISNIDEALLQSGVWPEPFGKGLPRIAPRKVKGARTRVSKNEAGLEVHNKLITEVPLQYTDDQTIEILFRQIDRDIDVVKRWARRQAINLRKRQKQRINLANEGRSFTYSALGFYPKHLDQIDFSDACATFEKDGFRDDLKNDKESIFQAVHKGDLAYNLGLPMRDCLFPFMCLLVIENPKITHTFLKEFDLYNDHGKMTGFTKHDAGYLLTGFKDRRGAKLSEQKLFLSLRSASLVKQIIEITAPLRTFLKAKGDDNWRKLFLTCGRGCTYPKSGVITAWKSGSRINNSPSYFRELESQFSGFTSLRGEELKTFLYRIGLSSLRASVGVQVYLRTQSVQKMAEALGHAKYNGALLAHYLPESILAFFQTRWIRIFQRAFICQALKDSPFLLQATSFESMKDLHEFLTNHALRDIPNHLSHPEKPCSSEEIEPNGDQVLISIDTGILSALLSLNQAVVSSRRQDEISGLARYWSDISILIEKEILNGSDSLLKEHLSTARNNLSPQQMEKLIYETAA